MSDLSTFEKLIFIVFLRFDVKAGGLVFTNFGHKTTHAADFWSARYYKYLVRNKTFLVLATNSCTYMLFYKKTVTDSQFNWAYQYFT